jgi:hypothetical protein
MYRTETIAIRRTPEPKVKRSNRLSSANKKHKNNQYLMFTSAFFYVAFLFCIYVFLRQIHCFYAVHAKYKEIGKSTVFCRLYCAMVQSYCILKNKSMTCKLSVAFVSFKRGGVF